MNLHIYTRELLEKHPLSELKEIAQCFSLIPEGNKTLRETWISALVGMPFPAFRLIDYQHQEPIEDSPGVEVDPVQEPLMEAVEDSPGVEVDPVQEPLMKAVEDSPGVDRVEELVELPDENSLDADRVQEPIENPPGVEPIEFPDLESALAEIARLRTQNDELLNRVRSQSEQIRIAKDISPVERPSLKRVLALAQAACLDLCKSAEGNWILSMGRLKRGFKKLRDIWDLLISDEWYLMDLFSPPPLPIAKKSIFTAATHTRYSAIPFCDDGLIDTWSLGVVVSSGRSPPGGEAM
jgi:hypothetical protein